MISYGVRVDNLGPTNAKDVIVTLEQNLLHKSPLRDSCTLQNIGAISCQIGDIAAGGYGKVFEVIAKISNSDRR